MKNNQQSAESVIPNTSRIVNIGSKKEDGNIILQGDSSYFKEQYLISNIFDSKEFVRFIKNVEKWVRTADDYTKYLSYLKELGLTSCAVLGNVFEDGENVEIEMHHHPFTLYDICVILFNYHAHNDKKFNTFMLAEKVLELHLENLVGLVPLCVTVHQLVHADEVIINKDQIYGYLDKFIERYLPYFEPEHTDKYNRFLQMSEVTYSYNDILKLSEHKKN
jgi:hypothetical protein